MAPTWHGSSSLPSRVSGARHKEGDPEVPFFSVFDPASAGLFDPITLQALGAHSDPLGRTVHQDTHGLQIGIPAPLGPIIGVTDMVAGDRPFGAHGAYPCHKLHPHRCQRDKPSNVTRARR